MNALSYTNTAAIVGRCCGWKPLKSKGPKLGFVRPSEGFIARPLSLTRVEAVGESLNLDLQSSDVEVAVQQLEQGAASIRTQDVEFFPKQPETAAPPFVNRSAPKKKKKLEDKNDFTRFNVRNGREVFEERAYLVGIVRNGSDAFFGIEESLHELSQLADTAGLNVVGSTYQKLGSPNPRTYIGSGKVGEVLAAIRALDVETVVFDDELSPGQLRNLERAFGREVRVCDRTALILDIFNQRAATREASLQVTLAQMEYQLPRLTRMWTHLERQAGGMVKGMGEKQIEVDKRILRDRIASLRKELESVRQHRRQYRDRRSSVPVPVVSLVGYTNAGKSTLLNRLSGADVLAEDRLFATLDPTTRRMEVAAFRATLEEIGDSSLLVHVVDVSHPLAKQQTEAVKKVLAELDIQHIPMLTLWNKVDRARDPDIIKEEARRTGDTLCISALNGDGLQEFCFAVEQKLKDSMVWVEVSVPYDKGELVSIIHRLGIVKQVDYSEEGTIIKAHVPLQLARQLTPMRQPCAF